MSAPDDIPEPDALEGAPHPRMTPRLFGQEAAERAFLDAFNGGRVHHGWLLTGPRGVGKATLAWKIARFLLAAPDEAGGLFAPAPATSLDVPEDHPIARRSRALAEPRLFLLRRGLNDRETALSQELRVTEVRKMRSFFTLSAADGGRRVAIVDSVDEMAPEGANALLKTLEEPPKGAVLILVSHQPARLLPTIRSRCRELRLAPLDPVSLSAALAQAGAEVPAGREVALAELAQGSAGAAFRLAALDGLDLYTAMVALFSHLPRLDRPAMIRLAEVGAARGAEAQFELIVGLMDLFLARLALSATRAAPLPEAAPGEAALFARLAPDAAAARDWAALAQGLGQKARRGKAVNLDPFALLVDMVLRIEETAATLSSRS